MVNQQNYIKNQGKVKHIKNEKNKITATQEGREKLEKHINALEIETKKTIKIDYKELLQHKETLKEKKNQLAAAVSIIRKYSQRSLKDYENLKKELEEQHHINKNEYNNLVYQRRTRLARLVVILSITLIVTVVAGIMFLDVVAVGAFVLSVVAGMLLTIDVAVEPSEKYDEAASETLKLVEDIEEINKLQKTIDLTERYQNLCENISDYISPLDPIQELKNAIPKDLQENNMAPIPASAVLSSKVLSSSEYLLRKGGRTQKNKARKEQKLGFTNDKQEENVKGKEEKTGDYA